MSHDVLEPATFVAAFNNEDPGVQSLAQRCKPPYLPSRLSVLITPTVYGLPPSIVSLAMGDIGVEEIAQLNSKVHNPLLFSSSLTLTHPPFTDTR